MRRGFTLIELMVVCAIIIVITGLIVIDNNKFGGEVILENLAYDVALSVRQAQIYGIAVNRFGSNCSLPGVNCFSAGYGMHFSLSTPQNYYTFADLEGTGVFDPNYPTNSTYPSGEVVEADTLQQGYAVTDLCSESAGASQETCGLSSLDILFKRPEPDAYISANAASGITNPAALQQEARVTITSPKGDTRSIIVYATGQISVQ